MKIEHFLAVLSHRSHLPSPTAMETLVCHGPLLPASSVGPCLAPVASELGSPTQTHSEGETRPPPSPKEKPVVLGGQGSQMYFNELPIVRKLSLVPDISTVQLGWPSSEPEGVT